MKISIILMQFPAPREVFASNDIAMISAMGNDVSAYSLRLKTKKYRELVNDRNLEGITITHNTILGSLLGVGYAILHPVLLIKLLMLVFTAEKTNISQIVKSMIFFPWIFHLFRLIQKEKPDVLHLYWSHYPALLGYLIKKTCPEIILTMSFIAYDIIMYYKASYQVAKIADHVFCISKYDRRTLVYRGIDEEKISVAYHGLVPEVFKSGVAKKTESKIISVGAFVPRKEMEQVVRVFKRVQERFPSVSLTMIGDGPCLKNVKKEAAFCQVEKIEFTGHVSHNKVLEEMSDAEIFLFLSGDGERLSNVIKEAMLKKCICVVHTSPGIRELLPTDEVGFVVENSNEAVERIANILENKHLYCLVGEKASLYIKENFNNQNSIHLIVDRWKKCRMTIDQINGLANHSLVESSANTN